MATLNENKIAIICCTNDEVYMTECMRYLNQLIVPKGMGIELLTIEDAKSMAAGYNEGMMASDAKYKLYIHQDSFLIYPNILPELVELFQNHEDIGMVGVIGSPSLPEDGVMWHGQRTGNMFWWEEGITIQKNRKELTNKDEIVDVDAVDGMFIATQYDIPWREDIFQKWDFYDISQAQEFKRAGYRVVVPPMPKPWVLHDCDIPGMWNYHEERIKFLKEYFPDYLSHRKRRFLYPRSSIVTISDIPWTLIELGNEVHVSTNEISLEFYDRLGKDQVYEILEHMYIDAAISHDFSPNIAEACYERGIPYIAWAFDAPLQSLYSEQAKYETNHIFCFDKVMMKQLEGQGIPHLEYMPLAANVSRVSAMQVTKEDEKTYSHDISMVGNLYEDNLYPILKERCENQYIKEIEQWIDENIGIWDGKNHLHGFLSEKCIDEIRNKNKVDSQDEYHVDNRFFYETLLARELTHRERVKSLNELAKKYEVHLYSGSDKSELIGVELHDKCDYHEVTPKIFHLSKINLNVTLRSIESGVPQRIYDIMAVGGFVLTNYQPEMEELFEIGKDLVVFHDFDEMIKLAEYYLIHEKERLRIAMHGYQTVSSRYGYSNALTRMIQEAGMIREEING